MSTINDEVLVRAFHLESKKQRERDEEKEEKNEIEGNALVFHLQGFARFSKIGDLR